MGGGKRRPYAAPYPRAMRGCVCKGRLLPGGEGGDRSGPGEPMSERGNKAQPSREAAAILIVLALAAIGCRKAQPVSQADQAEIKKAVDAWFLDKYRDNQFKPQLEYDSFEAEAGNVKVKFKLSFEEVSGVKRAIECTVRKKGDKWLIESPPNL